MFESIGQRLKKEREARFLTLEKVSEATRIRILFLQALEADDYSVMPSAAQGRGFLRNYAEYLELNVDEMIADIQKNPPASMEVSGPLPQVNLVETEVPSLTESPDEKPGRLSWLPRLVRRPNVESAPEAESTNPIQEQIPEPIAEEVKVEQPKARGRKKKKVVDDVETHQLVGVVEIKAEDATVPIDKEQVEVNTVRELKLSLISRLIALYRSRFVKTESKPEPEMEEESASVNKPELQRAVPTQPADLIFAEIGMQLRERRELISLTFEEVERHTKLRVAFVKALEEGAFDKLPSPVQMRGMLANYATFLGLDSDVILLRFADGLLARRHEKYAETPREKIQVDVVTSMPILRSFIAGDLIFGIVMISILAALAIWGVGRVVNSQDVQGANKATAPPIVEVLGSTPLPVATLISVEGNSLAMTATTDPLIIVDTPTPGVAANVTVGIFAVERAFARVSVDGEVVFEGRFAPGETKVFEADNQVAVLTGNASALRVTYNGRDLGLMGNVGEVVSRVYLITGIAEPTATISPTPTNTLPATITPVPTDTATITPTVSPPDGG
jgi:cytoskeleton protein RodZ